LQKRGKSQALYDFAGDTKAQIALYPRSNYTSEGALRRTRRLNGRHLHKLNTSPWIRFMRQFAGGEGERCENGGRERPGEESYTPHPACETRARTLKFAPAEQRNGKLFNGGGLVGIVKPISDQQLQLNDVDSYPYCLACMMW